MWPVSDRFAANRGPPAPSVGVDEAAAAAGAFKPLAAGAVLAAVVPAAAAIEANTAVKLGALVSGALEAGVAGETGGVAVLNGTSGLWATRLSDMSEGAMRNPFGPICDLVRW